jgi:uncharacterized membrane protein YphA (DoxX/SURF4 family)
MTSWIALLNRIDVQVTSRMAQHGVRLLSISLGVVFFWFGVLKFFPGLSPAQDLATKTISMLTAGLIPPNVSILVLATWECVVGLGLILGIFMRAILLLLFLQMLGTVTPLFFFPQEVFTRIPYVPNLEGQYIIKNVVLISAGLVIGATVRGGAIVADPQSAQRGQRIDLRS